MRLQEETRMAEARPQAEFDPFRPLDTQPIHPGGRRDQLRAERNRAARRTRTSTPEPDGTTATGPRAAVAPLSRRGLLVSGATAVAAATGTGTLLLAGSQQALTPLAGAVGGTSGGAAGAISSGAVSAQPVVAPAKRKAGFALSKNLDPRLLISRATYGRTAALEAEVRRLGATGWLNRQLAPAKLKDPGGNAVTARFPQLGWSATTARARLKEGDWVLMQQTVQHHLGRAVWSNRQLYEVMVDFWSNHLNVTCPSGDVWDSRHRYQIDVIRTYALGRFEDMLMASAFHPSMLVYLNNAQSTGQEPNENYARELLELHTVGIDGGYTERDVQRAALLLTGWKVEMGKASYDRTRHYVGSVRVMGFKSANASASKGRTAQKAYLRYLARHPRTARNIATKLARRFVSDTPSKALVTRLAISYRKHDTQIAPVLRDLFASPEFRRSAGQKIRRPMEHMVATARVLGVRNGADEKGLADFAGMLATMDHPPLGWGMPDGYADQASAWQSPAAALEQFNGTAAMVHGWWPTSLKLPGPKKILAKPPKTRNAVIDAVGRKVLGRKPHAQEASAARRLLAGTKLPTSFGAGSWEQQETVALTATLFLSSPAVRTR
jgi:uncharacterized protein (DUF1800 family)